MVNNKLYEMCIYSEYWSAKHRVCRIPKNQAYHVVNAYEQLHGAVSSEYSGLEDLTDDLTLLYWNQGHIELIDTETGEQYNYVGLQGGYGLEPVK